MDNNKKNVPDIRFPGFTDPWEQRKFDEITFPAGIRNKDNLPLEPYSITNDRGFLPQTEAHDDFGYMQNTDRKAYIVVSPNSFGYNPARINVGSIGYYEGAENVIVSSLYEIFKTQDYIDDHFLMHWFKSDLFPRWIEKFQEGSVRQYFYYDKLCECSLTFPSIEEQRKLSSLIDSIDTTITLHQRKCEELKKYKKGLLQQMFPQHGEAFPRVRFPGFTDPWEQRKLRELCERVQGNDGRMDLPTLTISAANGWMSQEDRFSGNIAGKEQKNYTLLHKGELSYNHGNSKLAKYGTVFSLETYEEALVPRVYHSFRMTDGNATFIEYSFATKIPDKELGKLISSGARMDGLLNIGYEEFMGINMMIPSIQEQEKISAFLRSIDNLIALHQRKNEELKNYKKGLLQKMFV